MRQYSFSFSCRAGVFRPSPRLLRAAARRGRSNLNLVYQTRRIVSSRNVRLFYILEYVETNAGCDKTARGDQGLRVLDGCVRQREHIPWRVRDAARYRAVVIDGRRDGACVNSNMVYNL